MEISSDECVEQNEMAIGEKDNKVPTDSVEVHTANTEILAENIDSPKNLKRQNCND